VSSPDDSTPEDDPVLRDALKRCSPATYYAACKFKQSGQTADLDVVVLGIMERFLDRELRSKLSGASDSLRLREDLGLDSLTMMEIVMIAEEVLSITVSNEELTALRTIGDVQAFIREKSSQPAPVNPSAKKTGEPGGWDLTVVSEDVRRIEARTARSASPLSN
jgi:3-hydroxyacyl-[acyl-carrier-protein] dehydratase